MSFNLKKSVIFRGPVLTQSGYGVHSRQVAKWLLGRQDVDVKFILTPWGDTPWILDKFAYDGLAEKIMMRSIDEKSVRIGTTDISFQLQLPNEWHPTLAKVNVGLTAAVESDKCNPEWVSACNRMQRVVVPSEHAKLSLVNSGKLDKEITVIPESYCEDISRDLKSDMPRFSTDFNFLVFGQITGNNANSDRKNIFNTIKWICEAFHDKEDVGIVIKTNMGRNTKIDKMIVTNLLTQALKDVRKGPFPKIHLVHGDMNDSEVTALYKHDQIKALVTLTRGEGYGLPILEAAACGLPVIATNWSGHTDFLNHGKFIRVFYSLEEVHKSRIDNQIFMKGTRWASASEEDFKKKILKFKDSSEAPREWAKDLQVKILEKYSFESICKKYDEEFNSLF